MVVYAEKKHSFVATVSPIRGSKSSITQRKLATISNRISKKPLIDNRKNVTPPIQRIHKPNGENITTLAALNEWLAANNAGGTVPIVMAGDIADVNQAVSDSDSYLYPYIDADAVKVEIQGELDRILAPPVGYEEITDGPYSAYVDSSFVLTGHQENLLISAANGQGGAVHRSNNTNNMSADADAYIHDYGDNAIFSYRITGEHRGIPMVEVLQQGSVNSGQHNF